MATKILNTNGTLTANQSNVEFNTGFTPKNGLRWVIVEVRPYLTGKGDMLLYVDDQLYLSPSSEDLATYGKPHIVAITIQQPVVFHAKFTDRSANNNFVGADITVEETSITGT